MIAAHHTLIVTIPYDTDIKQQRKFDAPSDLVFTAFI